MTSRFASALFLTVVVQSATAQATTRTDSAVVAKALDAVRTFQVLWEREWRAGKGVLQSRMNQLPPGVKIAGDPTIRADPRGRDVACIPGLPSASDHTWGVAVGKRTIASDKNKKHAVCPNWLPPDDYYLSGPELPDERLDIDNALERAARGRTKGERAEAIRELAFAHARAPRDSLVLGQYVRLLVDNGDLTKALIVTDNCLARASWCAALRGYVSYKLRQPFDAEDAFLATLDSLRSPDRCAWANISALLDEDARKAYGRLSCEKQDSVNRTVWWLADPLWSTPGNDRFAEQMARRVLIALHSALGRDERYNWTPYGGGDALAEMVERYGWMSFTYGSMRIETVPDLNDIYSRIPKDIGERRFARSLGGWRTTFEYSIGRVHVIPPMSMVNDPFSITNTEWSMNAPGGEWDFTFNWWPVEHYAPLNPLTKLVDQQTAFLRRQDTTLIAFATNLARTDLARKLGDSVTGVILTSPRPGAIRRVGEKRLGVQDRLTFLSALPAGPSLVSVEVPWIKDGDRGARSRFGVRPPPPLSAMKAGDVAMSDPVILVVPPGIAALPTLADSAITLMNGSTMLAAGTASVGVYWETYGIAAGDTVEITMTVRPRSGGGSSTVTSSWTEPQPGRSVRNIGGVIPIQMRSVVLDISAVPIGTYALEIEVKKRGSDNLRASREFTIR